MDSKTYSQSMIASYSERTAVKNAAYMLHVLKPHMRILDVGCGPGTISLDLATHVPDGHLTGVDRSDTAIDSARATAEKRGTKNASFEVGDIIEGLPFPDDTFDVVHAHQVLGHLVGGNGEPGPVRGLREMRRVCKPSGFVCAREADWKSFILYPPVPGTVESLAVIEKLGIRSGKTIAGGRGREFARRAGFHPDSITASATATPRSGPTDRKFWGEMMAVRWETSSTRTEAVDLGFITEEEATDMAEAWRIWAKNDDAFSCLTDGEIICVK
ncbi:methyltransferase type 11 [Xylariaceae sp. FL0255]|nr:methyltransferase type 11 [Xylariaceae sp. FL0255]